jgi:hypothetical protein
MAAKALGHDQDLALRVLQHEGELALAEDRHQRIEDGADPRAGEVGHREFPPVGQLGRNHVVAFDAEPRETDGEAIREPRQLAIGQSPGFALFDRNSGQGLLVRLLAKTGVENRR